MDLNLLAPTTATPMTDNFYDPMSADLPLFQENAGDTGMLDVSRLSLSPTKPSRKKPLRSDTQKATSYFHLRPGHGGVFKLPMNFWRNLDGSINSVQSIGTSGCRTCVCVWIPLDFQGLCFVAHMAAWKDDRQPKNEEYTQHEKDKWAPNDEGFMNTVKRKFRDKLSQVYPKIVQQKGGLPQRLRDIAIITCARTNINDRYATGHVIIQAVCEVFGLDRDKCLKAEHGFVVEYRPSGKVRQNMLQWYVKDTGKRVQIPVDYYVDENSEEFVEAEDQVIGKGEGDRENQAMDDADQALANPTTVQEPIYQQEDPDQQDKSPRSRLLQQFEEIKKSLNAEKSNDEIEISEAGLDEVCKLRFPDAEEETPEDVRYKPCNGRDWNLWCKLGKWEWLGGEYPY